MTLKERMLDAAEYSPDAPPPDSLAARALARLPERRRTRTRRRAAACLTAAACGFALWAMRPSAAPAPRAVVTLPFVPAPSVLPPRPARPVAVEMHLAPAPPVVKMARSVSAKSGSSKLARHRSRRFASVRYLSPRSFRRPSSVPRPLLTAFRPAPPVVKPGAKIAPRVQMTAVKIVPLRRIVPIVVARLSDDGSQLVLVPAAVVITSAASRFPKE